MKKIYFLLIVTILGLSMAYLSSDSGLSEKMELDRQVAVQKQLLKEQIEANQNLERHIVALQNHPEALETIARGQLGLVMPNETFVEVMDYRDIQVQPLQFEEVMIDPQLVSETNSDNHATSSEVDQGKSDFISAMDLPQANKTIPATLENTE